MATADKYSEGASAAVARQLAAYFAPASPTALAAPDRELSEALAICFLEAGQVRKPPRDLSVLARPSGVWHHQIRTGGTATHTARSLQSGLAAESVEVQQMAESPIAEKIDLALAWADKHVKGRATIRLLVAPAYYLHALLVVRDGEYSAVLADKPDESIPIEYEREYPLAEFLKALGKIKPFGPGMG